MSLSLSVCVCVANAADMVRRWCTLEGGFLSYYESEKIAMATGRVEISEMTNLAVNRHETMTGAGYV